MSKLIFRACQSTEGQCLLVKATFPIPEGYTHIATGSLEYCKHALRYWQIVVGDVVECISFVEPTIGTVLRIKGKQYVVSIPDHNAEITFANIELLRSVKTP